MPSTRASTVNTSARLRSGSATAASSPMPTSSHSGAGGRHCRMRAIRSRSERPATVATSDTAALLRVVRRTGFADDGHFDLTRVLELVLEAARVFFGQPPRLFIGDLFALDHDPDLAPRLQREGLRDALEGIGNTFQ